MTTGLAGRVAVDGGGVAVGGRGEAARVGMVVAAAVGEALARVGVGGAGLGGSVGAEVGAIVARGAAGGAGAWARGAAHAASAGSRAITSARLRVGPLNH